MKKVFSIMIILTFLMALLFVNVSADETATKISTEAELISFIENGGNGILMADIVLNKQLDVYTSISLDFNGYIISANDISQYAAFVFRSETEVVLSDSKGGGGIFDEKDYINITVEDQVNFTVLSGKYDDICANGGNINLIGGSIVQFGFDEVWPLKINWQNTEIGTWHIGCGNINKFPNQKLTVGFQAVKNDDGTYKVQYYTVDKIGETLTVYYDAYLEEIEAYQLTEDGKAPEKVNLQILYVNNGNPEIIPMECVDEEGRLWKCEFDKAYIGAEVVFTNSDAEITSYITNLPDESDMTYNAEKLWYAPKPNLTWFIVGGAISVIVVITVILLLVLNKKK